jgi:hypothetical protein
MRPKRVRAPRREGLRAQRHSIDARSRDSRQSAALDGARIRLQGDFRVGGEGDARPQFSEQALEVFGCEQAGRAAAKKYGVDAASGDERQLGIEVADQRVDVIASGRADFN